MFESLDKKSIFFIYCGSVFNVIQEPFIVYGENVEEVYNRLKKKLKKGEFISIYESYIEKGCICQGNQFRYEIKS